MALDIILLAVISYLIIRKLFNQFGKVDETDEERNKIINMFKQGSCKTCKASKRKKDEVVKNIVSMIKEDAKEKQIEIEKNKSPLDKKLDKIFSEMPDMNKESFLQGAEDCFEAVIGSFAKKMPDIFENLVSKQIADGMKKEILSLDKQKKSYNITIVAIPKKEVLSATIVNKNALIDVLFVSEQIMYKEDSNSNITDGDKERVQTISEVWTFKKDLQSEDPNWIVIETKSIKTKK